MQGKHSTRKPLIGAGAFTAFSAVGLLGLVGLFGITGCMDDKMADSGGMTAAKTVTVTVKNKSHAYASYASGKYGAGAAKPGSSFTLDFYAPKGSRFSFTSMFGQSNDWFFAPDTQGIDLYDSMGMPVSGDVTNQVMVWDAGTEMDEPIGQGPNQAPRQSAPNTGAADPDNKVRRVMDTAYADAAKTLKAMLTSLGNGNFRVTLHVVDSAPTPISPVAYQVHRGRHALFTPGMPDYGKGLEHLAEDGNPTDLAASLAPYDFSNAAANMSAMLTSLGGGKFEIKIAALALGVTPISPFAWSVHTGSSPLFVPGKPAPEGLEPQAEDGNPTALAASLVKSTGLGTPLSPVVWAVAPKHDLLFLEGSPDFGKGLEALAEDGNPAPLHATLMAMGLQTGTVGTAPIVGGGSFAFDIQVMPGDTLFLASMFGQSNDGFYAPSGKGIALWDGASLRMGDVTSDVYFWDAGTEANEPPGVGANQAPRQSAPNTGAVDPVNKVRMHDDGFVYPAVMDIIAVELAPK